MSAVARAFASRARALVAHWSQRPASTCTRRDAAESAASVIAPDADDAGSFELQHRPPAAPAPAAWNDWIAWMPMVGAPGAAQPAPRIEVSPSRAAVLDAAVDAARPAKRSRSATRESVTTRGRGRGRERNRTRTMSPMREFIVSGLANDPL
ncbi:hypothetical protein AMAG_14208 [Allomyces macrogynus ATCC 38327]|uniref:Uncharacterized protein n=1 Tax=Allomyces macrogynus (strain ATCC 38327) TaxID=578462 RepID=A0A0L0T4A9_ALLM3|nr:hypothetical protein AMAG_14208 [Allomyces macrogynus ATCC 38327]|eukprot:KNE69653.1 hypothetical protein AMAG_14208 [Allomyces macrogynus ATCC 38327]